MTVTKTLLASSHTNFRVYNISRTLFECNHWIIWTRISRRRFVVRRRWPPNPSFASNNPVIPKADPSWCLFAWLTGSKASFKHHTVVNNTRAFRNPSIMKLAALAGGPVNASTRTHTPQCDNEWNLCANAILRLVCKLKRAQIRFGMWNELHYF